MGSPTTLADDAVREELVEEASQSHGLYVAAGALWGAQDIQKMADGGTLKVCWYVCISERYVLYTAIIISGVH